MKLTLHVWRQAGKDQKGAFERYVAEDIDEHMSFLEMLDAVNEKLVHEGREPIAFDHDCREGICGSCGFMINGEPHGPLPETTVCQLHMRYYKDGDELWIEPWRARAFPVIKDLIVDRSAFDRIIQSGGYISVRTGSAPDANAIPVPKDTAELAMDAAAAIMILDRQRRRKARRLAGPSSGRAVVPPFHRSVVRPHAHGHARYRVGSSIPAARTPSRRRRHASQRPQARPSWSAR